MQIDSEQWKFLEALCRLREDQQNYYVGFNPEALCPQESNHKSLWVLIACSSREWKSFIEGADTDNPCLYGKLDIPITIKEPNNSSQQSPRPGYVCELTRSLSGTRPSGEIWVSRLDKILKQWDLKYIV